MAWPGTGAADAHSARRAREAHHVRFFEDDAWPAREIAAYLAEALDGGKPALAIVAPDRLDALRRELSRRRIDVDERVRRGDLVTRDAAALATRLAPAGARAPSRAAFGELVATPLRDALGRHGGPCRVHGEIVDVLARAEQHDLALDVEALWHELLDELPLELQCGYGLSSFASASSRDAFLRVCDAHARVTPARDRDEDRGRLVAELEQATSALRAEASARRDERARAEAATRAKDELVAVLGHELRNPLAPILTAIEVMPLRDAGAFANERAVIARQVTHMARLVDDLLDVSRITQGKLSLERRRIELARVVADAIEAASPLLERREHVLVTAVPASGLVVDADPARLAQAVANLLRNAAQYTAPHGSITIAAAPAGDRVRLTVTDDGIGIPPELAPRIFDFFAQGRQSSDRPDGGLGLGLAIARSLVELHGGTIAAESAGAGVGSTFAIELPLAVGPAEGASAESAVAPAPESARAGVAAAGARGFKVLVVDDNVDAASVLADALETLGHDVRTAHDGPSALRVVEGFEPEVALLDIGLPVMDGYELARRLDAAFDGRIKLVAVTGYGQEDDKARAAAAGFERHMVKPIDLARLVATLRELVPSRAARRVLTLR